MNKVDELKTPKFQKKSFIEKIPKNLFISYQGFLNTASNYNHVLIFDTNFLFVPFEFRVELISEIQRLLGASVKFAIIEETLHELEVIEKKKTKNKKFLPLIATFLQIYNVSIIKDVGDKPHTTTMYVDDILLKLPTHFIVATNDKELKQAFFKVSRRVIFMRQKSYLDME